MKNDFINAANNIVKLGDEFIKKFGLSQFPTKACELLDKANLAELYHFEQLVVSTLGRDFQPEQNYASQQFSDFPITIASSENCFLDLYFWHRRPTVIHDHHFVGAFQCLEGRNVDLEFEFEKTRKLGLYHDLGQLHLKQERTIIKGDIAQIDLLEKFIHQNHHQANLTVNACFRTPDIGSTYLSNFLYSGLKYEKHPELLNRSNRLMNFIYLGDFELKNLDISIDDALYFLIRNNNSQAEGKKYLELSELMKRKVENELGLNIQDLIQAHEMRMNELEDNYI